MQDGDISDGAFLQCLLRRAGDSLGVSAEVTIPTNLAIEFARLIAEADRAAKRAGEAQDPMFSERIPEAAARQMATVLAWATERHLDNLDLMRTRSRTPKSDLTRAQAICERLVEQCKDLAVHPIGLRGEPCPELTRRMRELRERGAPTG